VGRHRAETQAEVTDSADATSDAPFPELISEGGTELPTPVVPSGTADQKGRHARPILEAPEKEKDTSEPKKGAPSVDEWQDFIGRIVLHTAMEAYVAWVLRDIELSAEELESISLTKQDYKEMSAPFASFTAKNDWAKKHGREIISAADSIEAAVALGIWMRRVHKIARKHRNEQRAARKPRTNQAFASASQSAPPHQESQAPAQEPTQMPAMPARPQAFTRPSGEQLAAMAGAHIEQGANVNGNTGSAAGEGIRKPNPPGAYGGQFAGPLGTG
jgi:hypothetical protein